MKEQIETALTRRTFVSGDNDEVRKTATGHSAKTLWEMLITINNIWKIY